MDKKALTKLIVLIMTLVLAMATTMLFDWPFISDHWSRQALVYLLIALEVALGVVSLRVLINQNSQK